jgi:hypothetical protein
MTRNTSLEVAAREGTASVGLEMVRSDVVRMHRAVFDIKLGEATLATGLIIPEIMAVVQVLTSLNNMQSGMVEGDAMPAEAETA